MEREEIQALITKAVAETMDITDVIDKINDEFKRIKEGLHEINSINKYRVAKSQTIEDIIKTLTKK